MWENTDQKELRIWTLFAKCFLINGTSSGMLKTGFKMSLMMIGADITPSPLDSQSTLTLSHDEVDNTHIKNCFTMIVAATGGVLKGKMF